MSKSQILAKIEEIRKEGLPAAALGERARIK